LFQRTILTHTDLLLSIGASERPIAALWLEPILQNIMRRKLQAKKRKRAAKPEQVEDKPVRSRPRRK
jgi:hypothetical protein